MSEEITQERVEECAGYMTQLCVVMNKLDSEVLEAMLRDLSRGSAVGPLMDPTRWRDEDLFDKAHKTEKVLRAIQAFKKEVKGIGFFK